MRNKKHSRVALLLILVLLLNFALPRKSEAIIPLLAWAGAAAVNPVTWSLILHTAVAGVAAYSLWNITGGVKTYDTNSGDIKSPAEVTWVVPSPDGTQWQTNKADIAARVPLTDLQANISPGHNDTKYPNLYSALYTPNAYQPISASSPVNSIVMVPGYGQVKITSSSSTTYNAGNGYPNGCCFDNPAVSYGPTSTTFRSIQNPFGADWFWGQATMLNYVADNTPAPTPTLKTKAQYLASIGTNGTVNAVDNNDIDNFIKDNPNIIHFEDGGVPVDASSLPPGGATQAQINAGTSASQQSTALGNATRGAWLNYSASKGGCVAGPGCGDAGKYTAWQGAIGAQNGAAASGTGTPAGPGGGSGSGSGGSSSSTGTMTSSASTSAPSAFGDQSATFDFGSRTTTFVNSIKNSALFSLPGTIFGTVPSSSTSAFSVTTTRFGTLHYDMANFSAMWVIIGSVLKIVTTVSGVMIITKGS